MNVYYTGNGCFMTADELYHYGVPGMKWGKRKAVELYSNTRDRARNSVDQYKRDISSNTNVRLKKSGGNVKKSYS